MLADPGASTKRARVAFLALAALLLAPLLAFAVYLWSLGGRVLRAQEFPPPGLRVLRDTAVITGARAVSRGRLLKVLAVSCAIGCAVLGFLLWRFESLLSGHARHGAIEPTVASVPLGVPSGRWPSAAADRER